MSKSRGNSVDPMMLAETYGIEQTRYFLLRHMSIHQDGQFSIDEMETYIVSDLANGLGNLLSRVVLLALQHDKKKVAPQQAWESVSLALHKKGEEAYRSYFENMTHYEFNRALADVWKFIGDVNVFFNNNEPWKAAKHNKDFFAEVISAACHSLYAIGLMLMPIMPRKMLDMLAILGETYDPSLNYEAVLRMNQWNKEFNLSSIEKPLFERLKEKDQEEVANSSNAIVEQESFIAINDFTKVELHVGEIVTCVDVPGSDKLWRLTVDLGPLGVREVLSGVKKHFLATDLIGKKGIYVTNLAPRKMVGLISQGMMLFAQDAEGHFEMATVSGFVANGTRIS